MDTPWDSDLDPNAPPSPQGGTKEPDQPSPRGCPERVEVLLPRGGHRRTCSKSGQAAEKALAGPGSCLPWSR